MTQAAPNEWLVYTCEPTLALVRIADRDVGPSDPKRTATWQVRKYLIPTINETVQAADFGPETVIGVPDLDARSIIRPVRSPFTGTIVAVVAILAQNGVALPAPPKVGSWEWVIPMVNGKPGKKRYIYWNGELFDIYEVAEEFRVWSGASWALDTWRSQLLATPRAQLDVMEMARGLIYDRKPVLGQTYEIQAGYPTTTGTRTLRAVGAPHEPTADRLLIRGISMTADPAAARRPSVALFNDAFNVQMQLTPCPTVILDPYTYEVLAASKSWDALGLNTGAPAIELFHSDRNQVRHAIENVARLGEAEGQDPRIVAIDVEGSQQAMLMRLAPVKVRQDDALDVCMMLLPNPTTSSKA